ncbi:MAG TPA: tetratricopeptide repeat protein [Acidobacteriaceae bacterium]|jgi:tetratricopeptide (TPR) repeat protein|nr:tetratricopeptide repeat protein [Acidobacteriaceae bacterium]
MKSRFAIRGLAGCALALAGLMSSLPSAAAAVSISQTSATAGMEALSPEERGDILMARGEYLAAIEAYREAPPNAQVLNKTGIAYHHLLAMDLAKQDYEKALLIRPNYPEAINNLGAVYFAERDFKKAIRLYRKALELMPQSAVIAANLGTAYFARGKYAPGLVAYRRAFALDPSVFTDSSQIIAGPSSNADRAHQDYCIAELFAQAGMQARAIEYLRKALDEGFSDRNKLMSDAVFAKLRQTSQFAQLMAEQKLH